MIILKIVLIRGFLFCSYYYNCNNYRIIIVIVL